MRATITIALLLVISASALAGEVVECSAVASRVTPLWRVIDGRQCWFAQEPGVRRGRDKPIVELRWGSPPPVLQIDDIPDDTAKMKPPWEVEYRWPREDHER